MNTDKATASRSAVGSKAKKKNWLTRILSGDFLANEGLVKHIPFIAFVVLLFILNIGLMYSFEHTKREEIRLQHELNELRSSYNTTLSDLELTRQQSNVAQEIEAMGLKELRNPPQIIDVEKGFFEEE
jgi:Bacteriodetes cell division protein (FtsL-like)